MEEIYVSKYKIRKDIKKDTKRKKIASGMIIALLIVVIVALAVMAANRKDETNTHSKKEEQTNTVKLEEYNISEMAKLGNYKDMTVSVDVPNAVTQEDLENYVNKVLLSYPKYNQTGHTEVQDKDCVEIDLKGILKDDNSPCLDEKGIIVDLSNSDMIKEIQSALAGKCVGDTFDVLYTYPDNFADNDYSGKSITFTVTVKNIYEKEIVTYQTMTDDYAKNVLGCRTTDEFLSQIKTEMYEIITTYEQTAIEDAVVNKILNICSFDVPEEYFELKLEQEKELFVNQYCGGDTSLYEEQIYNYTGLKLADYEKTMREEIKDLIYFELIAVLIAEEEGYTTESAEYKSFISTQLDDSNIENEESLYELTKTSMEDGEKYVEKQFYMQMVTEYLINNTKVERTEDATVTGLVFSE